jgi:hypothetical protein
MATEQQERPSPATILGTNPGVDAEALADVLKSVEELRRRGVAGPQYGLASPYGHSTMTADTSAWAPSDPTVTA